MGTGAFNDSFEVGESSSANLEETQLLGGILLESASKTTRESTADYLKS